MKFALYSLLGLTTLMPMSLSADTNTTQTKDSTYQNTLNRNSASDLTQEEKSLARQWMLTDKDWVKYKKIMEGPRGIWSPGLDPLTALGVMETNPQERKRYAEIWMKMEIRRAELELAFEVERMAASKTILGENPILVDNKDWVREWNFTQSKPTHEVMMFVQSTCIDDKCQSLYKEVFDSLGDGQQSKLNIFFPQGTNAEQIGKWAREMGIDPEIVRKRMVTLNYDKGEYSKYDINISELPEVRVKSLKDGSVQKTFEAW